MNLDSAFNMRANRRRLIINNKTRQSLAAAAARMELNNALERVQAACAKQGHAYQGARCVKCGTVNPDAILESIKSEAA